MLHFNTRRISVAAMIYTVFSSATSCPMNCKQNTTCNEIDDGCPECKDGWYGRQCQHPLECYKGIGTAYNGTISVTENNITCQSWSSQTPNAHSWRSMESSENYCRNPNINPVVHKPWCYQTEGYRYAVCDIPKCEDQCPPPKLPAFGEVMNPPSKGFSIGVVLHVNGSCWTGQHIYMTCQNDKTWSSTLCSVAPWCVRPMVSEPSYISTTQSNFYYNDILSVLCMTGYEIPVGSNGLIRCEENKMWSNIPICTHVTCTEPVLKENSYISIGKSTSYKHKDTIHVVCVEGFKAIGESQFECKANREWNGTFPLCRVVECPFPALGPEHVIINGRKQKYTYMDSIVIGCTDGLYLGSKIKQTTCLHSGKWLEIDWQCSKSDAVETSTITQASSIAMASIGISCVSTIIAIISVATTVCNFIRFKRNNGGETANAKSKEESQYDNINLGRSSVAYMNTLALQTGMESER